MKYLRKLLTGRVKTASFIITFACILIGISLILTNSSMETKFTLDHINVSENQNAIYLYITISILSLTTLLSVAISFYLYKWRKILLSNPGTVVPEEWAKYINKLGENVNSLSNLMGNQLIALTETTNDNSSKTSNMINTYMELHSALDEKDQEIKRLKQGYDAEIFKKFIARFARIDQAIDDLINDENEEESEKLTLLKRLFEDAFEECGVKKFTPEIGEDYRTATGLTENPKTKLTDDPSLEFKIFEIIDSGYSLNYGESKKTIIPSKVKIYKLKGAN